MKGGTRKCAATNPGVKQKGYPQYKFSKNNKTTKQQLTVSNDCSPCGSSCISNGDCCSDCLPPAGLGCYNGVCMNPY